MPIVPENLGFDPLCGMRILSGVSVSAASTGVQVIPARDGLLIRIPLCA